MATRCGRCRTGFVPIARSANSPIAAYRHETRPLYGVQFHPEVAHTPRGTEIIANFLFQVCGAEPTWTPGAFIERRGARRSVRSWADKRVICGLSGGVDSAVAAALVHRAIGDQLTCVFVDTGLLRLHEREQVERTFRAYLGIDLVTVDAARAVPRRARRASRTRRRNGRSSATRSSTCSRTRSADPCARRGVPGAGHALSRRDRVGVAHAAARR